MTLRAFATTSALALLMALQPMAPALALSDTDKQEVEAVIRDYLLKNPEILIEMQRELETRREAERRDKAVKAVAENKETLFNSTHDVALGNPAGKHTIVEFFDYNCSYCKHALNDMDAIIAANPDVRFVLKEFPILGEDSVAAHRVSDAFKRIAPEKYGDFHRALLGREARADEAAALEVAASLGVSEQQIRDKMADGADEASFREAYGLAEALGITGTPSYIVGDEAIFGAIGAEAIKTRVANLESCGKTAC